MNVLLIYLQPKDIDEVLTPLKEIITDTLYLKYFPYPHVYKIAMKTIQQHPEYDYIFWLQNDIVLTKNDFWNMCNDIKKNNYDILGASMNVDLSYDGFEKCAFTKRPYMNPKDPPFENLGDNEGIIQVFHNGGPFICKRQFLIDHPLTGDTRGYNADYHHGKELFFEKIPYFLNADIHLKHLRYQGEMQVNKKTPEIEFLTK